MRRIIFIFFLIFCTIFLASCNVDLSGSVVSSDVDHRFRDNASLPEKSNTDIVTPEFSFIVISDPHTYHASHSKLAALKDKVLPGDQFILVCGDITECGYEEDYQAFCGYLNEFGLPYYTTIGNHDLYFGGWRDYKKTLGRSCYTFTAGPARFISLDSANGTLGGKQRIWLEQILKTKIEPLSIGFTHFDFFNPGFTDIEEVYYLMHLFENTNVKYVFMGHTHFYYHKVVNGVNYVNVPGFEDEGKKYFIRVFISGADVSYEKLLI